MLKFVVLIVILAVVIATPSTALSRVRDNINNIVGRNYTTIEVLPYQVNVQTTSDVPYWICSGSIISKDWIVTAAHCTEASDDSYSIRAGSTNYKLGGSIHNVTKIIRHPDFEFDSFHFPKNDIALMRVEVPFQFDQTRQPIKLFAENELVVPGSVGITSGWGATDGFSEQLKFIEMPVLSEEECKSKYFFNISMEKTFCVTQPTNSSDPCRGDSGAPFAINGRLAGILTNIYYCSDDDFPPAFTEVAGHRLWIRNHTDI